MPGRLNAVSIEMESTAGISAVVDNRALEAMLTGLSVIYEEVFIWSCRQFIVVWAVGDQTDLLVKAFAHHQSQFKAVEILNEPQSLDCFMGIVEGNRWKDVSVVDKLSCLNEAYEVASSLKTVGEKLQPIIAIGLSRLTSHPSITGSRNSWSYRTVESRVKQPGIIQIRSSDMFFRFSVN